MSSATSPFAQPSPVQPAPAQPTAPQTYEEKFDAAAIKLISELEQKEAEKAALTDGIVELDPELFRDLYPEIRDESNARLRFWFFQATQIVSNSPCSQVRCTEERSMLLMLLMRHFAELERRAANGGLTGQITSASEGSVSVSVNAGAVSSQAQWFAQTSWGLTFWQMTAKYRAFRYVRRRR